LDEIRGSFPPPLGSCTSRFIGYFTAFLAIVGAGLAAAGLRLRVWNLITEDWRRECRDVGAMVFLRLGVRFAVLLAFVFSEASSASASRRSGAMIRSRRCSH
jgi:hypothetical protein